MFWLFGKSKKNQQTNRGFTLLELIVVIAIFLIITAVVIADIPNFRSSSSLDLTTSKIATYIRGAQVYGSAQKSGGTDVKYGIHLDITTPSYFYLFKDAPSQNPPEESYQIEGFKIEHLGLSNGSGCFEINTQRLDIVFSSNNYATSIGTRLEPKICRSYDNDCPDSISSADIKVSNSRGSINNSRCIRVYANGQITLLSCADSCLP